MRSLLSILSACAVGAALVAAQPAPAPTAASSPRSGVPLCAGHAAIPSAALAAGVRPGCSLTGRTVVSGHVAVQVPPPGLTVAADGLSAEGESASLVVSNRGGVVIAVAHGAGAATAGRVAARTPADCRSSSYRLEDGRHPWATKIWWKLRAGSVPHRMLVSTVVKRLNGAFASWRHDLNDCGLGGTPLRLREQYAGTTKVGTGITQSHGTLRCGAYNRTNTVELGALPGALLGWTCYWWSTQGAMVSFDTRLSGGPEMMATLPKRCHGTYDLQSIATHEFGHAIGLAHVSSAPQTMHGVAPACSIAPRSLGRGDRRGLAALYGLSRR